MSSAKIHVISGVIIEHQGKLLMVQEKRADVHGQWNFPAGHVDEGETIEEAAVREAKEEVGYDVELVRALPVRHESIDHPVLHVFTARITGGQLDFPPNELLDAKWFTLAEIRGMTSELRSTTYILGALDALEDE